MKYRRFIGVSILIAGLFVSCEKEQPGKTALTGVSFRHALLVVDIQNEYLPMMDKRDVRAGMEAIHTVIGIFRRYKYPVIRVHHTEIGQGPAQGTEAFEFPKTVPVTADDPQIIKNHPSAFTETSLDSLLKARGCNAVYVCGLSAVGCALATYFGAMDRGYDTYMVREAIISHDADYTDMVRNFTGALPISFVELNLKVLSEDITKLEGLSAEALRTDYRITAPDQLNIIGYRLIFKDRLADAIIVMKTNLRLFSEEPNCYDSLGDVYERNNQRDLALSHYEKAYQKGKEQNDPHLQAYEKNYRRLKGSIE